MHRRAARSSGWQRRLLLLLLHRRRLAAAAAARIARQAWQLFARARYPRHATWLVKAPFEFQPFQKKRGAGWGSDLRKRKNGRGCHSGVGDVVQASQIVNLKWKRRRPKKVPEKNGLHSMQCSLSNLRNCPGVKRGCRYRNVHPPFFFFPPFLISICCAGKCMNRGLFLQRHN